MIERVVEDAIAALCAEAVGAMGEAVEMTTDYLKTRKQFGVPIGSFQALQHRAADMVVALEQARSMMYLATMIAARARRGGAGAGDGAPPRRRSAAPRNSSASRRRNCMAASP